MPGEVERKYLVDAMPGEWEQARSETIEQGYLAVDAQSEVRLRRKGVTRVLTAKRGAGRARQEIEVELGESYFDELWAATEGRRVTKRRFYFPLDGVTAEVDRFAGSLAGLITVEVEFESLADSEAFEPPDWFGAEVTDDPRFANQSLAQMEGAPERELTGSGDRGKGRSSPSRSYRIKRHEAPVDAVGRIALGRIDHALEQLRQGRDDDLASAVHGARKDLKKLRSLLRLVRDSIGKDAYRRENDRLRTAARALAGSRDAEAMVETVDALAERFGDDLPAGFGVLRARLERERDKLAGQQRDADSPLRERIDTAIEQICEVRGSVGELEFAREGWKLVGPGLKRSYKRGRKAFRKVIDAPDPANVHEWRKRVKDLWYQLRLIRNSWKPVVSETSDQVHVLADLLGDHHDLAVLARHLGERPGLIEGDARRSVGLVAIEERQKELLDAALALGERCYAETPSAFGKRMRAYWKSWQSRDG